MMVYEPVLMLLSLQGNIDHIVYSSSIRWMMTMTSIQFLGGPIPGQNCLWHMWHTKSQSVGLAVSFSILSR